MSLYNKYRPKDWDSVIGQEYITTILRNSLTTGRVHHAYLFHGSRGTGKTTSARILAKALNCLDPRDGNPCHECTNCRAFDDDTLLDIVEIDGASNNWVENVRDLIDRSRFEPNQAKYKIYIIDEVHMLSTWAFNALLKTLEQPPPHVKFILATTEIEKVPETIRSRTLRFDFRKIGLEDIVHRLEYVCKAEWLKTEDEALRIIAKSARGWLRDALTLLEQNMMDGEVSTEHVRYTLALVEESMIDACIEWLASHDVAEIQDLIEILREKHIEARAFLEQLMYRVRDFMIEHLSDSDFFVYSEILEMLESAYGRVRAIPDGMMLIEITLLRIVRRWWEEKGEKIMKKSTQQEPKKSEPKVIKTTSDSWSLEPKNQKPIEKSDIPATLEIEEADLPDSQPSYRPPVNISDSQQTLESTTFSYPALIAHLKSAEPALTTDLKTARFSIEEHILKLTFAKKWNHDRVNTVKIRNIITEACALISPEISEVKCILDDTHLGSPTDIAAWVF
jgi:DNA polymerase III subunit gamma/tau